MPDLLTHPLWQAETLGMPLPDDEFGVSVSLPLWRHVIGYEEGDQEVVGQFRSGYPRFFLPPAIAALFAAVEKDVADPGERCLVFPRLIHAERCMTWLHQHGAKGRTATYGSEELGVTIFAEQDYTVARKFWRYAGEVVSARQAKHALGQLSAATFADAEAARAAIRSRLATLSRQSPEDVFLFPSGMAATFAVHRMIRALFPGQRTVQLDFPYVDVLKVQQSFGAGAHFLPLCQDGEWSELEDILRAEPVGAIFSEVPTNPLLRCVDYARLKELLAHTGRSSTPLVVDDTIGTVANVDAFRVGDVVTTSLTKSFSGAGDVLAGSVILNRSSPHYPAFSEFMRAHADHDLWGADAVVLEQNSRDFAKRAAIMSRNSVGLYEYLSKHPKIGQVWHSINQGGPGYAQLQRADGHGSLFSFVLRDATRSPAFYDALPICKGPSLGTNFTLVCPYTLLAHYEELPWAESCGVPAHLIRVSAGLEPLGDLVARFERALAAV